MSPLTFFSLSSGSSGNAAYIRCGKEQFLIDAGLSLKRIELLLTVHKLDLSTFTGILITHAHGDHTKGLSRLLKKYDLPVFLTRETHAALQRKEQLSLDHKITHVQRQLNFADVHIDIHRVPHMGHMPQGQDDAGGTIGFIFNLRLSPHYRFAYFTDLGTFPAHLYAVAKDCDAYFIEANHDVKWQRVSRRPAKVIERNLSDFGHLSNTQTAEILTKLISKETHQRRTKKIMLAHVSTECNSIVLAEQTIRETLAKAGIDNIHICTAPAEVCSELITAG